MVSEEDKLVIALATLLKQQLDLECFPCSKKRLRFTQHFYLDGGDIDYSYSETKIVVQIDYHSARSPDDWCEHLRLGIWMGSGTLQAANVQGNGNEFVAELLHTERYQEYWTRPGTLDFILKHLEKCQLKFENGKSLAEELTQIYKDLWESNTNHLIEKIQ